MRNFSKLRRGTLAALIALALVPVVSFSQLPPARGRFLVAAPSLDDSRFARTVVLLIRHDEERSIGVMINRPTNISPATLFPESQALEQYAGTIYLGGPVAPSIPLILFREGEADVDGSVPILDDVFAHSDLGSLLQLGADSLNPARLRVFVGLAEWGPGQLASEINAGNWQVVNGTASQIFTPEPLALWSRLRTSGSSEVVRLDQPVWEMGSGSSSRFALR